MFLNEPVRMVFINVTIVLILCLGILIYRYVFPKHRVNLFILLILISILPTISIFRSGTYESGDLTLHSVFLQSFYENLKDGILIPQWAGGLCGGYGCPVFEFLYTLPFYISSFFHFFGFSYLDSIKLFIVFSYVLSGVTMYIFVKDGEGEIPAFVASLLYLFVPVRFIEMHFVVSAGSVAAFIFIPLAFLFAKKSLEGKGIYIILYTINFLFMILSHASITFIILPFSIIYVFVRKKRLKDMIYPLLAFILGAGLSSFYSLPAIIEVRYTWYQFTIRIVNDFKPILYYIYSPYRWGLLFQGHGDSRLIIGYAQIFVVVLAFYYFLKKEYNKRQRNIVIFLLITFFVCFTLLLSFTSIIWDNIFFLKTFQGTGRLFVPMSFLTAYLGAFVVKNWNIRIIIVFCILIIGSTILNWGNRKMVPLDPQAYYKHWSLYTEYFEPNDPLYLLRHNQRVQKIPQLVLSRRKSHLEIIQGIGNIKEIKRTQTEHEYLVNARSNLYLSENTYYFPG